MTKITLCGGKMALLGVACVSACVKGANPKCANVGRLKLFLKCAVGKFLKPCIGLSVGKLVRSVSSYSGIVNRVFVARKLVWKSKDWSFWCPPDGCTVVF